MEANSDVDSTADTQELSVLSQATILAEGIDESQDALMEAKMDMAMEEAKMSVAYDTCCVCNDGDADGNCQMCRGRVCIAIPFTCCAPETSPGRTLCTTCLATPWEADKTHKPIEVTI